MELEFAVDGVITDEAYHIQFLEDVAEWEPMIREIVDEILAETDRGKIAGKLHNALVEMIVAAARLSREQHIVLAGGCFQNKYLTERTVRRLIEEGFRPSWHQRVPPNDGGIALGQTLAVAIL
jgi:hydrogenase maturation protein HypF